MNVTTNHRLLLILYIFGLRTIHEDSQEIIQKLQEEVGLNSAAPEEYCNSKLFGLYRSRDDAVIFKNDRIDRRAYQTQTFASLQKMLNMNEAAFDPEDNMIPSLGQNMASFNIITRSVTR